MADEVNSQTPDIMEDLLGLPSIETKTPRRATELLNQIEEEEKKEKELNKLDTKHIAITKSIHVEDYEDDREERLVED